MQYFQYLEIKITWSYNDVSIYPLLLVPDTSLGVDTSLNNSVEVRLNADRQWTPYADRILLLHLKMVNSYLNIFSIIALFGTPHTVFNRGRILVRITHELSGQDELHLRLH